MQNCDSKALTTKSQNLKILVKVTLPAVAFMFLCNLCMTLTISDLTGAFETERKVASVGQID